MESPRSFLSEQGRALLDRGLKAKPTTLSISLASSPKDASSGQNENSASSFLPPISQKPEVYDSHSLLYSLSRETAGLYERMNNKNVTVSKKKKKTISIAQSNSRKRRLRRIENNKEKDKFCKTSVRLYTNRQRLWIANQSNQFQKKRLPALKKKNHRRSSSLPSNFNELSGPSIADERHRGSESLFQLKHATLQAKKSYDAAVHQVTKLTTNPRQHR